MNRRTFNKWLLATAAVPGIKRLALTPDFDRRLKLDVGSADYLQAWCDHFAHHYSLEVSAFIQRHPAGQIRLTGVTDGL